MPELWIPKHYRPKVIEKQTFVYFEDIKRHIIIPPTADARVPRGFQKFEISSAADIEKVSKRFAEQKARMFAQMDEATIERTEKRMGEIRTSLNYTLA